MDWTCPFVAFPLSSCSEICLHSGLWSYSVTLLRRDSGYSYSDVSLRFSLAAWNSQPFPHWDPSDLRSAPTPSHSLPPHYEPSQASLPSPSVAMHNLFPLTLFPSLMGEKDPSLVCAKSFLDYRPSCSHLVFTSSLLLDFFALGLGSLFLGPRKCCCVVFSLLKTYSVIEVSSALKGSSAL